MTRTARYVDIVRGGGHSGSTFYVMSVTGWSSGLEVSGGGEGVVSHAGLALLRHLADKTGLTGGLSRALAARRMLVHDRGRVLADLACAIADGARVISDFRVMSDQAELFGLVASVPAAWRTLREIACSGGRADQRVTAAVNTARRHARAQVTARHGRLPGVRLAGRTLDGVTCIRLDATVTFAHSDEELAEANFKGYGHHLLIGVRDNAGGEPLAWMLGKGPAGSNTAADHITLADAAIAALPPAFRRRLMVTVDGAGASHSLVRHLGKLAALAAERQVRRLRRRCATEQMIYARVQAAAGPAGSEHAWKQRTTALIESNPRSVTESHPKALFLAAAYPEAISAAAAILTSHATQP